MFKPMLLFWLLLFPMTPSIHAIVGSSNPSELFYFQESGQRPFYYKRTCSNHLAVPAMNCSDKDQNGNALPVLIAIEEKDYIEGLLRAGNFGYERLSKKDKARYLGSDGYANIVADRAIHENYLGRKTIHISAAEKTREHLKLLQGLLDTIELHKTLLAKIKEPEVDLVPSHDEQLMFAQQGIEKAGKQLLLYDADKKLWWRYLGEGDFYDAKGTVRYRDGLESLDQDNAGGCVKRFGPHYRLPRPYELRDMEVSPRLREAITLFYQIDYNFAWTDAGETFYSYRNSPSYVKTPESAKNDKGSILCVAGSDS